MSRYPKFALILFAFGLLLLAPRAASASCSCRTGGVRPCATYWDATHVFTGLVTEVGESRVRHGGSESIRPFFYKRARLKVEESFRDAKDRTIEVLTARGGSDCGYKFVVGQRYLVYAKQRDDGWLYTSVCNGTKPLAGAAADLSFIRGLANAPDVAAIYGQIQYSGRNFKDGSYRGDPASGLTVQVEGEGVRREVLTDFRGNFAVEGLPPGSYSVKPVYPEHARGYVDTTPFSLRAQQCKELGYLPWWDGRMSGKVLDAEGKPVPSIRVWLISPELDISKRENLMHNMWVMTKRDGTFELTDVPKGNYQLVINLTGDADDNEFGYPRTFYPGGEDRARAEAITLDGGEWRTGLDFRLTRRQAQQNHR